MSSNAGLRIGGYALRDREPRAWERLALELPLQHFALVLVDARIADEVGVIKRLFSRW
jgi:hypothetical protein